MPDYSQTERLDRIQRELARQSVLMEQILDGLSRLQPQAPAAVAAPPAPASAPTPTPKPNLAQRLVGWLRGAP